MFFAIILYLLTHSMSSNITCLSNNVCQFDSPLYILVSARRLLVFVVFGTTASKWDDLYLHLYVYLYLQHLYHSVFAGDPPDICIFYAQLLLSRP